MAIQENISSTSQKGPVYSFGFIIPCNVKQAFEHDAKNSNTLWKDAMTKEIENIHFYKTFKDMGIVTHGSGTTVHIVFVIKHDLRHKAQLVAGGRLTPPTMEGCYSLLSA
jgi:hypothetical protein